MVILHLLIFSSKMNENKPDGSQSYFVLKCVTDIIPDVECYLWRECGLIIESSIFILRQTLLSYYSLQSSSTLTLAHHIVSLCFRFFNCTMKNLLHKIIMGLNEGNKYKMLSTMSVTQQRLLFLVYHDSSLLLLS